MTEHEPTPDAATNPASDLQVAPDAATEQTLAEPEGDLLDLIGGE